MLSSWQKGRDGGRREGSLKKQKGNKGRGKKEEEEKRRVLGYGLDKVQPVLICFPITVLKHSDQNNSREKGFASSDSQTMGKFTMVEVLTVGSCSSQSHGFHSQQERVPECWYSPHLLRSLQFRIPCPENCLTHN